MGVALDNHRLKWWHLLLSFGLTNVGGGRGHAGDLAHLGVVVALGFLRGIISSFNLLLNFCAIFQGLGSLLIWQVVVLDKLVLRIALPFFV